MRRWHIHRHIQSRHVGDRGPREGGAAQIFAVGQPSAGRRQKRDGNVVARSPLGDPLGAQQRGNLERLSKRFLSLPMGHENVRSKDGNSEQVNSIYII